MSIIIGNKERTFSLLKNRYNTVYAMVRTGEHTVYLSGYESVQITGEPEDILCIDPIGGPMICKGEMITDFFPGYQVNEGTGKIYKIEMQDYGALLTIL